MQLADPVGYYCIYIGVYVLFMLGCINCLGLQSSVGNWFSRKQALRGRQGASRCDKKRPGRLHAGAAKEAVRPFVCRTQAEDPALRGKHGR